MRFLADESCDFSVVRALRTAGHDVLAVVQTHRGAPDEVVFDLAVRDGRILLTEDRDFGQLVFASNVPSTGVIYIRFPAGSRAALAGAVTGYVAEAGPDLADHFVVIQPGRVRVSRRP